MVRRGNVQIELPNGAKCTKTTLKEAVHAPDMAFTLISVSWLNDVKCSEYLVEACAQSKTQLVALW